MNKEFNRLRETTPRKVNFRVIVASNHNLEDEVKKGNFRSDLYYRLKVIEFVLPPLRGRKEDLPLLIGYFLNSCSGNVNIGLGKEVIEVFTYCTWPGNIRELEIDLCNH